MGLYRFYRDKSDCCYSNVHITEVTLSNTDKKLYNTNQNSVLFYVCSKCNKSSSKLIDFIEKRAGCKTVKNRFLYLRPLFIVLYYCFYITSIKPLVHENRMLIKLSFLLNHDSHKKYKQSTLKMDIEKVGAMIRANKILKSKGIFNPYAN